MSHIMRRNLAKLAILLVAVANSNVAPGAAGAATPAAGPAAAAKTVAAASLRSADSYGRPKGGFVAGNFGIAAQLVAGGTLDAYLKFNPPVLGHWLEDFGVGRLSVSDVPAAQGAHETTQAANATAPRVHPLHAIQVSSLYPEYRAILADDDGLIVEVHVFAPLALDSSVGFLPALIVQTRLHARVAWRGRVGYSFLSTAVPTGAVGTLQSSQASGIWRGPAFVGLDVPAGPRVSLRAEADQIAASTTLDLAPGTERSLTFVVGRADPTGRYANVFDSPRRLLAHLAVKADAYANRLAGFIAALPKTGDDAIDRYLRWYTSAGILLTKGLRTGEVLTMGYVELNQRDSFWSSGAHLVFWPDLEKKMIEETVQSQRPDGRIPVTILPVIDRGDELDSAEYFILRVSRYWRWYRDKALLDEAWPATRRAIDYLASRDAENVGVPMQTSFWADWKDVPGVEGRKYAPHFDLLWVAALKAAAELAPAAGDPTAAARYDAMRTRAEAFLNRPFEQGGMWNGTHYVDRWADSRKPSYVLLDQTIGAYFDVVSRACLESIYDRLKASETAYGVRETFPYAPYSSGYRVDDRPGNYHNGGIWPWLNFVDVAGRYRHGRADDAERIIREVGHQDLDANDDEQPGEFMNGDTGKNMGFAIQAWDASLFSAIYFGAYGAERISAREVELHVRIPQNRDFSTRLLLPMGAGTLSSHAGKLMWAPDAHAPLGAQVVKLLDERGNTHP